MLGEQIENDVNGWMRCGQFLDATRGGMQTQLQFVERKCAANWDDQFSVENELLLWQLRHIGNDIWKITRQRLTGLRLQMNLLTIAKRNTAKAIPLRLVLPLVASRNFVDRPCFHRWQGRF